MSVFGEFCYNLWNTPITFFTQIALLQSHHHSGDNNTEMTDDGGTGSGDLSSGKVGLDGPDGSFSSKSLSYLSTLPHIYPPTTNFRELVDAIGVDPRRKDTPLCTNTRQQFQLFEISWLQNVSKIGPQSIHHAFTSLSDSYVSNFTKFQRFNLLTESIEGYSRLYIKIQASFMQISASFQQIYTILSTSTQSLARSSQISSHFGSNAMGQCENGQVDGESIHQQNQNDQNGQNLPKLGSFGLVCTCDMNLDGSTPLPIQHYPPNHRHHGKGHHIHDLCSAGEDCGPHGGPNGSQNNNHNGLFGPKTNHHHLYNPLPTTSERIFNPYFRHNHIGTQLGGITEGHWCIEGIPGVLPQRWSWIVYRFLFKLA